MRYGICLPQLGAAAAEGRIAEFASRAEQLGYDDVWVGDRLLTPLEPQDLYPAGGTPEEPYPPEFRVSVDPLVALSAAAGATRRVRLASSTLNAPWYNAVVLARALTSLDVLSAGRLDAGFGISWMRDEYEAAGVRWSDRGALLDETLDVLQAWWSENPVEHHGPHFEIARSQLDLRPVQPGGPPILLGGFAPVALRRVGRRADGWLAIHGTPPEYMRSLWDIARAAAEEAGRDPGALRRELRVNAHGDEAAPERLAALCAEADDDGVDGVHIDLAYVATSVDDMLERSAALAAALGLRAE